MDRAGQPFERVGDGVDDVASERLGVAPNAAGDRPPLAISSCGNAALAAAKLAAAVTWPLEVYVPTWANAVVVDDVPPGATVVGAPARPISS